MTVTMKLSDIVAIVAQRAPFYATTIRFTRSHFNYACVICSTPVTMEHAAAATFANDERRWAHASCLDAVVNAGVKQAQIVTDKIKCKKARDAFSKIEQEQFKAIREAKKAQEQADKQAEMAKLAQSKETLKIGDPTTTTVNMATGTPVAPPAPTPPVYDRDAIEAEIDAKYKAMFDSAIETITSLTAALKQAQADLAAAQAALTDDNLTDQGRKDAAQVAHIQNDTMSEADRQAAKVQAAAERRAARKLAKNAA